jgi:hypothetical protein
MCIKQEGVFEHSLIDVIKYRVILSFLIGTKTNNRTYINKKRPFPGAFIGGIQVVILPCLPQ